MNIGVYIVDNEAEKKATSIFPFNGFRQNVSMLRRMTASEEVNRLLSMVFEAKKEV